MDHASASFTSPWAVLSGHAITSTNAEHSFGHHHGLPMDLQYPYYRVKMLPYSAIDYAAYQTRTLIHPQDTASSASAFTHSWLVQNSPDLCGASFKTNQQTQQILDPGHVNFFIHFATFI
ncbi:hypothetical protein PVAND_009288 [Polypedilum vanderplanki]|uniref:Uncharacterized protein n=1 Tax=Polypedilum vanderplanki TaxID=319348 RepID=A0A9J6CD21_POLVA|nr:hypothetical protein PVAND_009288 [Polypedilum vanderplanki]